MRPECLDRLSHPKMEYYRSVYKDSERWNGVDDITGKRVVVYCEQGLGDTIQFARYIPLLKQKGCEVVLHCPSELSRLFAHQFTVHVWDKDDPDVPKHDYHIPSMSLPFVLNQVDVDNPYLEVPEKVQLDDFEGTRIGIAWEGNPEHSNADERNCPLVYFSNLQQPDRRLYCVQKEAHNTNLMEGADGLELYGYEPINDFYDTATLLNSLDCVVTVDTSILHLAGAMGKKTYAILSHRNDPRWDVSVTWYPTVKFISQRIEGDWNSVLREVSCELETQGL